MEVPKEPSPKSQVQIAPAGEGLPVKVAVLPLVEVVNDAWQEPVPLMVMAVQ